METGNYVPYGFQVDEIDDSRVRVRAGLVQVEGALLVAADDGVPGHPPRPPRIDLEEAPRADDGALGEGRARVGEQGRMRLTIYLCGERGRTDFR